MKKFLLYTFTALLCLPALAQDQHFSQFYASPLTLNPALTGLLEGKYRVSTIYRDQWRASLDNPYQTFSAAADFRYKFKKYKKRYEDYFGVGVILYNDKVNQINFSTNQMMLSGAFHKALNPESDQYLSLGVQIGIVQRNINYGQISFDDQFNGTNGYTDPTGEVFPENNFAFSDVQLGLHYTYSPEDRTGIYVGVAMHHLLEPEVSFFYRDLEPDDQELYPDLSSTLFRKYSAHVGLRMPLGESVQFLPRALVYSQGPHFTLNAGANFRFLVSDISGTAIHLGAWARPVRDLDNSMALDAIVGMLGIEHSNFLIGFSYDVAGSQVISSSRSQNTFEISVAYLGEYDDESVLCPKF